MVDKATGGTFGIGREEVVWQGQVAAVFGRSLDLKKMKVLGKMSMSQAWAVCDFVTGTYITDFGSMRSEFGSVQAEFSAMRADMRALEANLRTEMHQSIRAQTWALVAWTAGLAGLIVALGR